MEDKHADRTSTNEDDQDGHPVDDTSKQRRYITRGGYLVEGRRGYIPRNDTTPRRPLDATIQDLLPIVGGLAAIITGLTYFIGLLSITAEFAKGGVSISDTLPLLPLSQVFSRGLPAMLLIGILLIACALLAVLTDYNAYIRRANRPLNSQDRDSAPRVHLQRS